MVMRFLRSTRAGATAITAVVVTLLSMGATAFISDHVWLVDQRDVLKSAANAAGIAATNELPRLLAQHGSMTDDELKRALEPIVRRYIDLNLQHLSRERYARAMSTLQIEIAPDRRTQTVDVSARAEMGGVFLSKHLRFIGTDGTDKAVRAASMTESVINPVEVALAIDVSWSMKTCLDGAQISWCGGWDYSRMSIVQRAAKRLVAVLEPSATNRVAIGVVPWHGMVRLGSAAAADWQRNGWAAYPSHRVYPETYACLGYGCSSLAPSVEQAVSPTAPEPWQGCLDSHRTGAIGRRASLPATIEDALKTPSDSAFVQAFFPAILGASYACSSMGPPFPNDYSHHICYDGSKITPWSGPDGYGPDPAQYNCRDDVPGILPLSTDADEIEQTIDTLLPVGNSTYSAIGLLWGQRLLDHSWKPVWGGAVHPVDPDDRSSEGMRKALVLLTDGEDTLCGSDNQGCENSAVGFARADACTAIKAAGTEIFVIAAMDPSNVSGALGQALRDCSSESDNPNVTYAYLNNQTPAQLEATFVEIASQLRVVRRIY